MQDRLPFDCRELRNAAGRLRWIKERTAAIGKKRRAGPAIRPDIETESAREQQAWFPDRISIAEGSPRHVVAVVPQVH